VRCRDLIGLSEAPRFALEHLGVYPFVNLGNNVLITLLSPKTMG